MARRAANKTDDVNETMEKKEDMREDMTAVEDMKAAGSAEESKEAAEDTITLSRSELVALIEEAIKKDRSCTGATEDPDTARNEAAAREADARSKELVKVTLPFDGRRYKDPVFVAVNGKSFRIERGVEVEVPAYVAETLRHSQEQDMAFMRFAKENENRKLSMDEI